VLCCPLGSYVNGNSVVASGNHVKEIKIFYESKGFDINVAVSPTNPVWLGGIEVYTVAGGMG
jgi:hypothetical protein